MTQLIELHHRTLCSIFALALSGCLVKVGDLEAGLDDGDTGNDAADNDETDNDGSHTDEGDSDQLIECLMGTLDDTIGTEQSVRDPECGVVTCAEGWGHDGEQLEIALTLEVDPPFAEQPYQPRALGLLENGHVVVAIDVAGAIDLQFFDPAAELGYGGFTIDNLGSTIYDIGIHSQVLYVTHGDDDGNIELRAVDIASQQQLWAQAFAGYWATEVARNGGKLAFALTTDQQLSIDELVVLDLDGNVQFSQPTVEDANAVAISPSGARVAVSGELTRVYSTDDGELLDEFVYGSLFVLWPQSSIFVDEDHLVSVGSGIEHEKLTGWLSADSLSGDITWEHIYNRASSWCADEDDDEYTAETAEVLSAVTRLADGSLVAVGSESFDSGGVFGSQPWVARFSADGEFLGSDRGLWDGFAIDSVAAPDGSAFVLIAEGPVTACELPCDPATQGFAVRKYIF
jgi:hypothetical protein